MATFGSGDYPEHLTFPSLVWGWCHEIKICLKTLVFKSLDSLIASNQRQN